jgi:hypothetical protein
MVIARRELNHWAKQAEDEPAAARETAEAPAG